MKTLLIIDASAIIHRAYHALPPLTSPAGEPIGAIYGLASTLIKVLGQNPPDYIAAAFDRPEPTFRKKMFADYKAHRPPAADELIAQIIKAHEVFAKFQIPSFEIPGLEADDLIGTLTEKFGREKDLKIVILTGDLDTLQLIQDDKVVVQFLEKKIGETKIYDENAVVTRYGLLPEQLIDYKALVGDPSDNIPGLKGVGAKTAAGLLQKYGALEKIYAELPPTDKLASKILPFKKEALLCQKLATIDVKAPLAPSLESLKFQPFSEELKKYLGELGFQSLLTRLDRNNTIAAQPAKLTPTEAAPVIAETAEAIFFPENAIPSDRQKQLADSKIKVAYDWSEILRNLKPTAFVQPPLFDLHIAAWLINSDAKDYGPAALCANFLRQECDSPAATLPRLYSLIKEKLEELGLVKIFREIEMPLIPILNRMEKIGIGLNRAKLKKLTAAVKEKISEKEKEVAALAGIEFNLNSPKQVGELLFEKLGLKSPKKRAKISTAEEFLQTIADQHPIVPKILEYRELFKLQSTYLEPFAKGIAADNRLHARFLQTGAATGRLSSAKPNMQNLPQDSAWSQPFRDCFEAADGWQFLSFDYSQIELRLLADLTDSARLKEAFAAGRDIHQLTAAQVLKIPFEKVEPHQRRLGKTLNFGVIYGMGPNNFARQSGVSRTEAQDFIAEYFRQFPEIKLWQEEIKETARRQGWIANLNGRRRWFSGFSQNAPWALAEMERAAINMPIQSLGADIIKMAMVAADQLAAEKNRNSEQIRLLLSIHDELLFEIKNDILMETAVALKKIMENVITLAVPLKVDSKTGSTWGQLKTFSIN